MKRNETKREDRIGIEREGKEGWERTREKRIGEERRVENR